MPRDTPTIADPAACGPHSAALDARMPEPAEQAIQTADAVSDGGDTSIPRRRLRYIARAAYYIAVHRSFKHWRWALAAEGATW